VLNPIAFWDASALVPLCTTQPETSQALCLYQGNRVAVWWATPIEIISALTRLRREGAIRAQDYADGALQAELLASFWRTITPTGSILADARILLERFPLRAADAMQLAAALRWCGGNPDGRVFISFDKRLRSSAHQAGFTVA